MAAGTWKIYAKAKYYIGAGTITLGAGVFKLSLHRTSASASILVLSTRSTMASIAGQVSATGGYVTGGRNLVPTTAQWVVGTSARQYKFKYTSLGLVFTGNAGSINNIKYGLIHFSNGASAGTGKVLCFCTLSSTAFTVASGNTLTITPAASGVFTLA